MPTGFVLRSGSCTLSEASIFERLRRHAAVRFDPHLAHAALIYDPASAAVLAGVHRGYLDIGQRYGLPMIAQTDTWRASAARIAQSAFAGRPVNEDNVRFLAGIRAGYGSAAAPIILAGQTGPRGDAYRPEEAPGTAEAERYHAPQAEALASAGVELFVAATLPALPEAVGIARVMGRTGVPYIVSVVVRRSGTLLDGTPLARAIDAIDALAQPPAVFGVNCTHPDALAAALEVLEHDAPGLVSRVGWFQANASARDPEEIDGSATLDTGDPGQVAAGIARVHDRFGVTMVGGCCGTDDRLLTALGERYGVAGRE